MYDANVGSKFFSVCSDTSTAPDQVTCYSNNASFLDILAPSHNAYTTYHCGFGVIYTLRLAAPLPRVHMQPALQQCYSINAKSVNSSFDTPAALKAKMVNNGDPIVDTRGCGGPTKPRVNVANSILFHTASVRSVMRIG